jgi:4-hydroxy-3-polyprenylbenzoate decarboxylase
LIFVNSPIANEPQRESIFARGPANVLDHANSEMPIGSKLGIDATKKLPGEGFKRPWPPLIKMDSAVRKKIDALFGKERSGAHPPSAILFVVGS